MRRTIQAIIVSLLLTTVLTNPVLAQPWDLFVDPVSGEACDLVNASNVELVVYSDTGELVIVSETDLFLGDTFVDGNGDVFFDGEPFGFIDFAVDGDGLPSLWWLSDFGTVVEFDLTLFLPFDSGVFPDQFLGVECDACPFWDDPLDCVEVVFDTDEDGVFDDEDLCPDTFPGEEVDFDGCSCEDLGDCDCFFDSDLDGIVDCEDFCFDTPIGADVDIDGCACFEVDDDQDGIDNCDDLCPNSPGDAAVDIDGCTVVIVSPPPVTIACGSFSALMMGLTLTGLFMMRFVSRRNW